MVRIKTFSIVLSIFLVASCLDQKIGLKYEKQQKIPIRIDGYYYHSPSGIDSIITVVDLFYSNGICLNIGGVKSQDLNIVDDYIKNNLVFKKSKIGWGVFNIDQKQIQFERWLAPSGGGFPTGVFRGEIINDSTFFINSLFDSSLKKHFKEKTIYHFREYSHKPDSTNNFIK